MSNPTLRRGRRVEPYQTVEAITSTSPDACLVAACLAGDAQAWEILLKRYSPVIYALLIRQGLSSTDAEDLFQEVWVLVLNHLEHVRNVDHLDAWLTTTTRRVVWRWRRRRGAPLFSEIGSRQWELDRAQAPGIATPRSVESTILARVDRRLIHEAMSRLPERCNQLLSLLYCQDPPCTYQEIALRLGVPLGGIGPSRSRCLQCLKKILDEMGF
jgi:RNA polymerase sigma factor (sigma-70 family)